MAMKRLLLEAFFHLDQQSQAHRLAPIINSKVDEQNSEETVPTPELNQNKRWLIPMRRFPFSRKLMLQITLMRIKIAPELFYRRPMFVQRPFPK